MISSPNDDNDDRSDWMRLSDEQAAEVMRQQIDTAFERGRAAMLGELIASSPLELCGRWERDRVYDAGDLVHHDGGQFLTFSQTASEPSDDNAVWRRVSIPQITDTNTEEGKT